MTRDPDHASIVHAGALLETAQRAAVLVHGRDQGEHLMLDVAARLGLDDVAYLLPVSAAHTWYDGRYFDPVEVNEPQLGWALDAIEGAVAVAREAGVPDRAIALGGFSQGACMVAELMARRPRSLAGLAILTGALLGPPQQRRTPRDLKGLSVYAASSVHDAWIPIEDARSTADAFIAAGASVTFEELDDREHLVSDRAVAGLRGLLTAG